MNVNSFGPQWLRISIPRPAQVATGRDFYVKQVKYAITAVTCDLGSIMDDHETPPNSAAASLIRCAKIIVPTRHDQVCHLPKVGCKAGAQNSWIASDDGYLAREGYELDSAGGPAAPKCGFKYGSSSTRRNASVPRFWRWPSTSKLRFGAHNHGCPAVLWRWISQTNILAQMEGTPWSARAEVEKD